MTTFVAYEVRVQRNDTWRVEAVFDDRELAIAAARRLEKRLVSFPVVVLQEIYDVARNHLKSRSIYRSDARDVPNSPPKAVNPFALRRGMMIILLAASMVIFGVLTIMPLF